MTSMDAVPGRQGAARQNWQDNNPRPILQEIINKALDPHDRATIREEFFEAVTAEHKMSMQNWWFANHYDYFLRGRPKQGQTPEQHRAEQAAKREESKREVAARATKIKRAIEKKADAKVQLMLTTVMPIGKAFGDCTGSELRQMRDLLPKALTSVLRKVGDNQLVRSVLSNKDLQAMNLRFV